MNEVDSEGLARKRSSEHLSGWASKSKTGTSKSMHDNDCTETMREQISGRECKKQHSWKNDQPIIPAVLNL